jgi:tetratricopeptide (TPR) repeat protein
MSNYEFWDELGKIFNAVVAYQEKSIQFNQRFINPWIRLGNVFDKQDRNREAIEAYRKAIEIDPDHAQNWYELGNLYFRCKDYDLAVEAFNQAIQLEPQFGWPYSNLALTLVAQGKHSESIPLYQKSIDLLKEDKDKAMAWNRLGNVYRKINDYEHAVEAFHKADELDAENGGFRDDLDEAPEAPVLVNKNNGTDQETEMTVSPIQLIVAGNQAEEVASPNHQDTISLGMNMFEPEKIAEPDPAQALPRSVEELPEKAPASTMASIESKEDAPVQNIDSADKAEQTVTDTTQSMVASFAHSPAVADTSNVTSEAVTVPVLQEAAASIEKSQEKSDTGPTAQSATTGTEQVISNQATSGAIDPAPGGSTKGGAEAAKDIGQAKTAAFSEIAAVSAEQARKDSPAPVHAAYEEFLKDNHESLDMLTVTPNDSRVETPGSPPLQEPVTKIDDSGNFQIEMDTKNAHVWNELGNVYFNNGAYDDAIVAYSKAIELDRWFAWPYSNLALAYVQKGRLAEAILLYQRSIELFTAEKDKSISWNRLGNVYRRLNDYDNAIAAYQRADELDPDNTTLSLQSRFSLLGNYHMDQKPSYVS